MGITPDESPVCKCCGRWASHLGSLIRTSGGEMHPACWDKHHSHPSGPWPEDHACAVHRGAPVVAERIAREIEEPMSTTPEDSDVIERAARAYDPEAFEDHPIEQRRFLAAIQWGARRRLATEAARRLAAAGLLTPAGAAWHTDPPPGWSTFGAHAFMSEVPALEFWGEEYGGDGLPIWERPVPAPDADVAERIATEIKANRIVGAAGDPQVCADLATDRAVRIARSHATPPVAGHSQRTGWTHDPEGEDQ